MSEKTTATVWHNGSAISARCDVLETLDIREHQSVSESQAWKIIELNALRGLAEIEAEKSPKNKSIH